MGEFLSFAGVLVIDGTVPKVTAAED